jgi:4-azaleucine resistance transporter AzlC
MQERQTEEGIFSVSTPITFNLVGLREGAKKGIPLALSVFAYGLVFGVLARQARLSLEEALLMSSLVFAGAAQFIALELWVQPLPIVTLILTTFIVNLRYVLMGVSLSPILLRLPPLAAYGSLFFMADESWAIAMREQNRGSNNAAILLGSGISVYASWFSATFIGRTLGNAIENPEKWGLDFAFTAAFTGMLVGLWKGRSDIVPWSVAALIAVFAQMWLPGKWYIVLGGLAGSLVGMMRYAD